MKKQNGKRLSDLIEELENKIDMCGDLFLQEYVISDEMQVDRWSMLSPSRKNKQGGKAKMNIKEFREFCISQEG